MTLALCVVPVAGNAARPLVRDLVKNVPGQAKFSNPERPAASKLGVDPYLRVIGARDMVSLGDCSMMVGDRLPATAQVRQAGSPSAAGGGAGYGGVRTAGGTSTG
jgi:NADH dehydrogenase FAD-containing subunit